MKMHIAITDRMGHELETHVLDSDISSLQLQQEELYASVKSQRDPSTIYFFVTWDYQKDTDKMPFNSPRVTSQKGYTKRGLVGIL